MTSQETHVKVKTGSEPSGCLLLSLSLSLCFAVASCGSSGSTGFPQTTQFDVGPCPSLIPIRSDDTPLYLLPARFVFDLN